MSGLRLGAFVQGGTRGLGLALARALVDDARFECVVVSGRTASHTGPLDALEAAAAGRLHRVDVDVRDEPSIARAAGCCEQWMDGIGLLINCAGVLHGAGLKPEKRLEQIDRDALMTSFEVNAIGPLLVARHLLPLLRHGQRAVVANVSARVGSIADDRLGGWYGYRASKAAQNMFTRNLSIELARRAPESICVAIHPGTVDTELSRPFQRGLPEGQLRTPERAARDILAVLDSLTPADSGSFRAWDGSTIPW